MRADKFFAERYGSRTKAAEALKRGLILCGGKPLSPDDEANGDTLFEIIEPEVRFVSNGGYKLERGLEVFPVCVRGKIFADLGASTGGFTDCLLQHGAKKVYCVDVGESQLAPALAADPRVTVMDNVNARFLKRTDFPEPPEGIVSDLSFISQRLVLPAVSELLEDGAPVLTLFKPQFECGRAALGKSGICPPRLHGALLSSFYEFALSLLLSPVGIVPAPIREKKNIEYMVLLIKGGTPLGRQEFLLHAAENRKNSGKL